MRSNRLAGRCEAFNATNVNRLHLGLGNRSNSSPRSKFDLATRFVGSKIRKPGKFESVDRMKSILRAIVETCGA